MHYLHHYSCFWEFYADVPKFYAHVLQQLCHRFPGAQGGAGFADVLFGKVNPAGRSPQTYYMDDAQLPKLGNMDLYAGNGKL